MSVSALPDQLSEAARAFASRRQQLLIDGEFVDAADGRTFETPDPSTGQAITEVAQGGAEDVDRAVKAARRALEDGAWRPGRRVMVGPPLFSYLCCKMADFAGQAMRRASTLACADTRRHGFRPYRSHWLHV